MIRRTILLFRVDNSLPSTVQEAATGRGLSSSCLDRFIATLNALACVQARDVSHRMAPRMTIAKQIC
jgi:hypothetical protein